MAGWDPAEDFVEADFCMHYSCGCIHCKREENQRMFDLDPIESNPSKSDRSVDLAMIYVVYGLVVLIGFATAMLLVVGS